MAVESAQKSKSVESAVSTSSHQLSRLSLVQGLLGVVEVAAKPVLLARLSYIAALSG